MNIIKYIESIGLTKDEIRVWKSFELLNIRYEKTLESHKNIFNGNPYIV